MKELFNNQITIQSNSERIKQVLLDGLKLKIWNPSIMTVDKLEKNTYEIRRNEGPNRYEKIIVKSKQYRVIYQSTGGYLEYKIEFDIKDYGDLTDVRETFLINSERSRFPIKLLTPIAKNAFNHNLTSLKLILDRVG